MRKILVATDGSENALRALDFARQQALLAPVAELHILTVPQTLTSFVGLDIYLTAEKIQELRDTHARAALQAAEQHLAGSGCGFTLEQLDGEPAATIARRAEQLGCESIVMGTHGLGRLGLIVMGSIAQRVVHESAVPVTLVK